MLEVAVIDRPAAAEVSLDPIRQRILAELAVPGSASSLAPRIGLTRQKVNYHLRTLEEHGLVELVEERKRGNMTERIMQASAASYVISPAAMSALAPDPSRFPDQLSARWLVTLAARIVREVGELIAGATALLLSRALNSLSLGSDTATALGSRVARTQLIGLLAITVLCGSATAIVGPIAFIGLMMPHMARWLVGADHRWSLPVTLLATPALLLFADIIGRVIVPGELRVSVVSAFIGAPVLIFLVRRKTRGGA